MDMDSPANFYDTDFFGTEQDTKQKFLFESSAPIDFGDNIGGLYENENSIDFSQYIHQSGEQPNSNFDILQNFGGLSTSPPKPHEFTLPPLITIKPDPDAPVSDLASVSDIDTAPCTPAVTDSNPGKLIFLNICETTSLYFMLDIIMSIQHYSTHCHTSII